MTATKVRISSESYIKIIVLVAAIKDALGHEGVPPQITLAYHALVGEAETPPPELPKAVSNIPTISESSNKIGKPYAYLTMHHDTKDQPVYALWDASSLPSHFGQARVFQKRALSREEYDSIRGLPDAIARFGQEWEAK